MDRAGWVFVLLCARPRWSDKDAVSVTLLKGERSDGKRLPRPVGVDNRPAAARLLRTRKPNSEGRNELVWSSRSGR